MSERSSSGLLPDAAPPADLVLSKLDTLPTLAPIAFKLLQVTTDDRSSARDVVVLIENDPSLTAKLLGAANAAAGGARVKSIDQAVVLLGFATVRTIVLTVKIFECFQATEQPSTGEDAGATVKGFDRAGFWRHALGVACAARRLARAETKHGISPDDAYVAGLLHDLGKIAMSAVFPKAYDRVAAEADHLRGDIADNERGVLGVDHTVVGRRLADRWRLPQPLLEVIWLHHVSAEALPSSVESAGLISVVQLADTIVREQRIGYSGNHVIYEPSREAARRFGLAGETLELLIEGLVPEVSDQVNLLGLDRVTSDHMYVKALSDANAELGRMHTEMSVSHGRLTIDARYFSAMCELDARLDGTSDLRDVAQGGAYAAAGALQLPETLVFVRAEHGKTIEVCRHPEAAWPPTTLEVSPEFVDWADDSAVADSETVVALPGVVARLLAPLLRERGSEDVWLLPITRSQQFLGGILFFSERDERRRLRDETKSLRSFILSVGLAIETARAHSAARRLSDDLAGANRRLQQAQAKLLRSRTLSMIAEMASGAAHELNSPLTVISGRAQILMDMLDDPEMLRSLETIRSKAHECSRIVSELMDFAKPRSPVPAAVELPDLIAEVREEFMTQSSLPASSFVVSHSERLPHAQVDRAQIKTLLTELVNNAADAIEQHGGNIAINCRAQVSDGVVEVTVRDNGTGMTPAVLERVFDPFFSHHKAGRRRGFGLARAHRIVEAHGGRIWLESRPNEGTVAHVVLPAVPAGMTRTPGTSTTSDTAGAAGV